MKTFLIVLAILALLGIVIFLLIRKPERVIDDDSIIKPGNDYDIDKGFVENHQCDKPQDGCLQESKEKESEEDKAIEVNIPEHCRIPKCNEVLPNKYIFNIHKYTSKKGREMFCVVCSAVINNENYRIIVKNSYYPYIKSYTTTIADKIRLMFENDKMSVEDFIKLGSTNFVGVGDIVESL